MWPEPVSDVGDNPTVTNCDREGGTFKWKGDSTRFRMWSIPDQEMKPWATSSTQTGFPPLSTEEKPADDGGPLPFSPAAAVEEAAPHGC